MTDFMHQREAESIGWYVRIHKDQRRASWGYLTYRVKVARAERPCVYNSARVFHSVDDVLHGAHRQPPLLPKKSGDFLRAAVFVNVKANESVFGFNLDIAKQAGNMKPENVETCLNLP